MFCLNALFLRTFYFLFVLQYAYSSDDDGSSEDLVFSSSLLESMPHFPLDMFGDDEENSLDVTGNSTLGLLSPNLNLNNHAKYQCHSCEQPDCLEETICNNAYQCWKSRVRDLSGLESVSKGCTTSAEQVVLYCNTLSFDGNGEYQKESSSYAIECCEGNFCNNGSFPVLPTTQYAGNSETDDYHATILRLLLAILCPVVILGIALAIILLMMRHWHRRRMARLTSMEGSQDPDYTYRDELRVTAAGDSTLREVFEHSVTSGSGSGMPLLIQRTLAKQITLGECIGKGRYGEVWRGLWHGESVAVKIFFSRDEASWTRETEIYSTMLFRHENILGYIGSDMTSRNSITQLWLVTHYHPLGSLYDHLNRHSLNHVQLLHLCISAISGILHLHTEIFGTQGKPAIAHRDIKTKNILVRSNGMCVIADFGLAVTHTQTTGEMNVANNPRVGTKRYMSPEVLDQTINMSIFESFRRVDMYAFGLVLWEMCRRTVSSGLVEEYRPPFFDMVPSDPSFEDMRKVVCIDQYRPIVPSHWESDPILSGIWILMKECWHQNPNVRLPALRLKKSLLKLAMQDPSLNFRLDF
ncbi:putative TGF-beta receptor type I saxophone protein [Daphnia sinensis]|uniref:receptor protein serine/threonine kinase n=1 Tax=Daphnia sinensis TaxID=1820382 RepID=A0AAD5PTK4_9CRUS|nr:putative TGF-beta receptor type I saxophone protein [Daphnia sinensis]